MHGVDTHQLAAHVVAAVVGVGVVVGGGFVVLVG